MKKIIAGITLFLILMGALSRNADWLSTSRVPENNQIHIALFSDSNSNTSNF